METKTQPIRVSPARHFSPSTAESKRQCDQRQGQPGNSLSIFFSNETGVFCVAPALCSKAFSSFIRIPTDPTVRCGLETESMPRLSVKLLRFSGVFPSSNPPTVWNHSITAEERTLTEPANNEGGFHVYAATALCRCYFGFANRGGFVWIHKSLGATLPGMAHISRQVSDAEGFE